MPRLQQLYEWSAHELGAPGLLECVRDGALTYAWPFEERDVWRAPKSIVVRVVHRTLPPERKERDMGDDAATQKRRRVRWIQRYSRQSSGEGGGVVRAGAGLRARRDHRPAKRQAAAQRRRHAHRRQHRLGGRRTRPARRLREQPRSGSRRPGPHAPPLASGPCSHRGRRRSAGPARLVRPGARTKPRYDASARTSSPSSSSSCPSDADAEGYRTSLTTDFIEPAG